MMELISNFVANEKLWLVAYEAANPDNLAASLEQVNADLVVPAQWGVDHEQAAAVAADGLARGLSVCLVASAHGPGCSARPIIDLVLYGAVEEL